MIFAWLRVRTTQKVSIVAAQLETLISGKAWIAPGVDHPNEHTGPPAGQSSGALDGALPS